MNNDKFILDATAGFRMIWFNKKHPNCIYLDERPECEPDIVGDFRNLEQFKDETFRLIVFDPPHIIRKPTTNADMIRRYGALQPEEWQSTLRNGFKECWRVLKRYGILLFKWNTSNLSASKVLDLFPEKPLFYQNFKRQGDRIYTTWFCFMKMPEQPADKGDKQK